MHSPSRRGLLAGGNWIVDHVKMIDVWPTQDALANIVAQSEGNGGGAYNVAKNLARLGCGFPLAGVGLIGRDADGETILRDCEDHDIDHSGIEQTMVAPTSYTDVMTVSGTGRRTFFHQHGANALLDDSHFDLGNSGARIFYLGYLCLLKKLDTLDANGRTKASRLLEQARKLGMTTVADLVSNESGDFAAIVNPSLPFLDYLFLNDYELARLAPIRPAAPKRKAGGNSRDEVGRLEKQARRVLMRGVRRAVIVHWAEGALCVGANGTVTLQPAVRMPAREIVGAAGAGDAFSAGFLLGLHEGWPLQRSLELAVCAAAASLRHATCSVSVESRQNCLALGAELGFYTA